MNLNEVIRIIREIAVICVVLLVGYRVIDSDFNINLGTLSATDIVALLLAFFAVGLSAAFYFKSSDSSNKFYDNMHKFTQDTSVVLWTIQSGFGEQLKNIEQKSQDLKESVDRYYTSNGADVSNEIAREKAATEKQVSDSEQELGKMIETLFEKSKLDDSEKQILKSNLKEKELELKRLQSELNFISNEERADFERGVNKHLTNLVRRKLKEDEFDRLRPMEFFLSILLSTNKSKEFLKDMQKLGYLENSSPKSVQDITANGEKLFISILNRVLPDNW